MTAKGPMRIRTFLLAIALLPLPAWGISPDALRTDAPSVYTVKKGDTLWDIAGKFLESPWRWEELWDRNPYISNPDLIYPGDRLMLRMVDGEPRLSRQRVERLSPQVKEEPVERLEAISTVDRSLVLPFIDRYGLLDPGARPGARGGHLVAGEEQRSLFATGDRVFASLENAEDKDARSWYTYAEPQIIRDPENGKRLGYLLEHTGLLRMEGPVEGGLFAARIRRTYAPIEAGDRIYPGRAASRTRFTPHPAPDVAGRLLRHVGGESMMGQGQIVVLDLGARNGLEKGHVLLAKEDPRNVEDRRTGETEKLPGRRKGTLVVIQTSQRLSFALIMGNSLPLQNGDRVVSPES
ncbi:LysM peptidoglycan-binding domain-containing protein [Thiohalorhabdus sp. Cl-TMA]|uniref:LysM peptidoglycan-binding domain-containing protein n=1 Tax=Thiohalorhabdus methylotrophus TaxID=3242694 RepID=A0ABV4TRS0_9GAMM